MPDFVPDHTPAPGSILQREADALRATLKPRPQKERPTAPAPPQVGEAPLPPNAPPAEEPPLLS